MSRKSKSAKGTKREQLPDAELMSACLDFAANVRAAHAHFEVDPTGNNEWAGTRSDASWQKASSALLKLADIPAETLVGLNAKARVASILLEDRSGQIYGPEDVVFLFSFASDTKKITEQIMAKAN